MADQHGSSGQSVPSSRIIVKNLPKHIQEPRLRELFAKYGELTQVKLLSKRRMAYIGFKDVDSATAAVSKENDVFVDTSKIEVAHALAVGDQRLPRPWSKQSRGSSAYESRESQRLRMIAKLTGALQESDGAPSKKKKKLPAALAQDQEQLARLEKLAQDPSADPQLAEYMQLMGNTGRQKTWANDALQSSLPNPTQAVAGPSSVEKDQPKPKVAYDDDNDSDDEEYQDLPVAADQKSDDARDDIDTEGAGEDVQAVVALQKQKAAMSNLDWLRSKTGESSAADFEDDDAEAEEEDPSMLEDGKTTDRQSNDDSDDDSNDDEEEDEDADEDQDHDESDNGNKAEKKQFSTDQDGLEAIFQRTEAQTAGSEEVDSDAEELDEAPVEELTKPERFFTVRVLGLPFKAREPEIVGFFKPLKPIDVRLLFDKRKRSSGRAFVDFATKPEWKKALEKHKSKMGKRYIEVTAAIPERNIMQQIEKLEPEDKPKKDYPAPLRPEDEDIGESGRLFVRNLPYACREDELRELFEAFGPLSELHMPIDGETKKPKGFAFITFVLPEHASQAFQNLDNTIFQGRLLHVLPARHKPGTDADFEVEEGSNYKKDKATKQKQKAGDAYNWSTLFLRQDAVAEAMADEFGVSKGELMDDSGEASLAVRMALGESNIIAENKRFLEEHGVKLSAFDTRIGKRSTTTLLVKNLPFAAEEKTLRPLFEAHGDLSNFVMPPSRTMALVEYMEPSEARRGFRKLAYRKYKDEPLYLEWAPKQCFVDSPEEPTTDWPADSASKAEPTAQATAAPAAPAEAPPQKERTDVNKKANKKKAATKDDTTQQQKPHDAAQSSNSSQSAKAHPAEELSGKDEGAEEVDTSGPSSSVFVKNLHFDTDEDALRHHFEGIGPIRSVRVARKPNPKEPSRPLSMGFGFVEYKSRQDAVRAIKMLHGSSLQEHTLELKMSERTGAPLTKRERQGKKMKAKSNKLVVRNIAFEATPKEVQQLFSPHGNIVSVRLPRKQYDGTHRGFAFIEFSTKQEARDAFSALSGTHLYGRRLAMEFAEDDESLETLRQKTQRSMHQSDSGDRRDRSKRIKFDD